MQIFCFPPLSHGVQRRFDERCWRAEAACGQRAAQAFVEGRFPAMRCAGATMVAILGEERLGGAGLVEQRGVEDRSEQADAELRRRGLSL